VDSDKLAQNPLPPAIIITGPTAAGKTRLVETLFERFPISLISADSAQVYRRLDIGSAKPDPARLLRYPHALINIRWPEQAYSAADFVADAEAEMRRAAAAGRVPVLVGGTVLYLRALLYGLDPLPAGDPAFRAGLSERAEREGWPALHAELSRRDPKTAATIRATDPQRIQRALEVLSLTGLGLAAHHSDHSKIRRPRFFSLRLVLTASARGELHRRIETRLQNMLREGFIEEVEQLRRDRPALHRDCSSMRAVGYRQVWQFLDGKLDRSELAEATVAATRQLAKRQLTWLRKFNDALWYDPAQASTLAAIGGQVESFMRTLAEGRFVETP
jgi:tRNA dimethylallyltransferase